MAKKVQERIGRRPGSTTATNAQKSYPETQGQRKNVVLCSDGTGNTGGKIRGTNVWKIFQAIDRGGHLRDDSLPEQIVFHDDGVGTERFKLLRYLGGAFGWGLSSNIRELYTFLVKNYQLGDRIYLFGFSRGAFTVRSLAGMIDTVGVVNKQWVTSTRDLDDAVEEAFRAYRDSRRQNNPDIADAFRGKRCVRHETLAPKGKVKIRFIGVWDTVDAIGVPFDEIRDYLLKRWTGFHQADVVDAMENGYHAISIDDERKTFHPVMWDERKKNKDQTIEQVWFAGVHSNVGGGYPREELATITLDWMMAQAQKHELRLHKEWCQNIRRDANAHGRLYNSRSGLMAYYRYLPRNILDLCKGSCLDMPKIHISVFERIQRVTVNYAPGNFPSEFEVAITKWRDPESGDEDPLVPKMKAMAKRIEGHLSLPDRNPIQDLANVQPVVQARRNLYRGFLAWTFAVAVLALLAQARQLPETMAVAGDDTHWWVDLGAGLIGSLVPSFVEKAVLSLWHYPVVFVILTIPFVALLLARRKVERRYKDVCLDAWRRALPIPLVGERAAPPEAPT